MTENNTEKKKVINLYAAFGASLVLSVVPSMTVGLIALVFLIGVLMAAYRMRKTAEAESLTENHTTFIIRTIWIATLISVLSLTAGSAYMLPQIDYTAFAPCAESLATKGPEFAQNASFEEVYAAAQPCMHLFIDVNLRLLTITALIVALPIIFYLIFRYVRGLSRAAKGYRIANPRSWL